MTDDDILAWVGTEWFLDGCVTRQLPVASGSRIYPFLRDPKVRKITVEYRLEPGVEVQMLKQTFERSDGA